MGAVKLTSLVRKPDRIDGHRSSEREEAEKTIVVELSDLPSRSARRTLSACAQDCSQVRHFQQSLIPNIF